MRAPTTPAELFQLIIQSELLDRGRLEAYWEGVRAAGAVPTDAAACGQLLVADGLLTQFQARILLQGKWKNFFLGGKYKVLDQLGAGGMGAVFLCEHRFMRRRVAVKILPPDRIHSPSVLQRFYREAEAIARLDHPNIVRAHDVGHHGSVCFLVLEYIDGVNLQRLVEGQGPLPVLRAVNYAVQAAQGLHCAHRAGLVHRDVKPANLLLDRFGVIKVLDLGLALFADGRPKSGDTSAQAGLLGTADYIAPEQAQDAGQADARSDVYSLGCTLYFMLAGQTPYHGGSVAQKLALNQTTAAAAVANFRQEVPAGVADAVRRMLAKDPAERPASALAAAEFLRPWFKVVPAPPAEELPTLQFGQHGDLDAMARTMSASRTLQGGLLEEKTVPISQGKRAGV
ncbi:MAG TPA: serine/threonine-protein kinase [Gemmataceae bacterium]|nr:serine/threonine-protein kinase [Gemmataceae bacterium]